jgi:hypothetical protein
MKTQHTEKPMNKKQTEKNEAKETLLGWLNRGETVYTICDHVSQSGMMRHIRLVILKYDEETKKTYTLHPNYSASKLLGWPMAKGKSAIKVGGCGMDMGFHTVYSLSHMLFGDGYALKQEWL